MRRLFRLLLLGGLIAGGWAYLRRMLQESQRPPLQRVGDVAESVEGAAKSAAETAKSAGENVKDQVASAGGAIRDQATSVTTGGNGTADLSKAELYKEAQKLDVEGRSKMSKDQLADAVARARRGGS
jgi:hypothetical protein